MDKSQKHYLEGKKLDTEEYTCMIALHEVSEQTKLVSIEKS